MLKKSVCDMCVLELPQNMGKNGTSIFTNFCQTNSHWLKPPTYSWKPVTSVLKQESVVMMAKANNE